MMKKLVVADRLNPLVETVFTGYQHYQGGILSLIHISEPTRPY